LNLFLSGFISSLPQLVWEKRLCCCCCRLVMEQQLVRQFCSPDADTLMFQVTDEQPIHPSELMRR